MLTRMEENSCTLKMSEINYWNSRHIVKTRRAAFNKKMYEYTQKGMYTDVDIVCRDRTFKCHRLALAAASDFFHHEFSVTSTRDDVHLSNIDGSTFEMILRYVYRGEIVAIDDGNVFDLLKASHFLKMNDVEEFCVHHLTQKSIPKDHALEIFLFAQFNRKPALVQAVSQFILQHLDHFCHERDFLHMSFADFCALYVHSPNSSASQEKGLLGHCHNSMLVDSSDDGSGPSSPSLSGEITDASDVNSDSLMETDKSTLYVYVGTAAYKTGDPQYNPIVDQFRIPSALENGEEDIEWHNFVTVNAATIEKMRIVESGDRLYALKLRDRQWTFSSSTAFDLSANVRVLTPPRGSESRYLNMHENFHSKNISLCPLRTENSMYLCGLYENVIDFQSYDIELDLWTPVPVVNEICQPKSIMHADDARLYIIGRTVGRKPSCRPYFAAYDPRAGEVQELDNGGLIRLERGTTPGCYHNGRFYLPEEGDVSENDESECRMAIYDPRAGRWDVQQLRSPRVKFTKGRRLESFDNRLWMFDFHGHSMYITAYNAYVQEWDRFVEESPWDGVGFLDAIATKSF